MNVQKKCKIKIILHVFLIRKPFFCLSLSFLNSARNQAEIFLILFLNFYISLFFLILYLIRFNTNNKRHFHNNGEAKEF